MAVTENYPQLKSDQNFRDLQSQIEGTENRITVARDRYIQAVQSYNVTVRSFPVNLTAKMFGFQVKPNFTVANEQQIATAPTVSFDTSTTGTPGQPRRLPRARRLQERPATNERGSPPRRWPAGARAAAAARLGLAAVAADAAPAAQGLQPTPKLTARVTDLTGTLTAEQQTALEQKLAAFEAAKGSQLAVLIVPTTQPEDIFQYSFRVAEQWKLGRATVGGQRVDDGALLVIAKDDRHVWIQVGYGLEGVLTDAMCRRIVDETMTPAFRQGNFYGGIDAGLDQMMRLVKASRCRLPSRAGSRPRRRPPPEPAAGAAVRGAGRLGGAARHFRAHARLGLHRRGRRRARLAGRSALALAGLAAVGRLRLLACSGADARQRLVERSAAAWGGFGGGLGGGFGGGGGGGFSGGGGGFGGGGAGGSW